MGKVNFKNNIEDTVINNILTHSLIQDNDKIVVAVSGGPDSMCLLNTLINIKETMQKKYNISYELYVAHVNHMIRQESDEEKIYVEDFCKNNNIEFYCLKADIPTLTKEMKLSEETCGRKIRYEFFDKVLKKVEANKIAVAHNLDDNVETILLNIIRGCGLKGIGGMNYSAENIIRPLLNIEKKDILKYCEELNIDPRIDKTNFEDTHSRNKVRIRLIPTLKNEYNANIMQNIIRMSEIVKADEDFLEKYTKKVVENSIIKRYNNTIEFTTKNILNEHEAIIQRSIRLIISEILGDVEGIEQVHVLDIVKLIKNNIKGKKYIIGNKFTIEIKSKFVAVIYSNN